MRVSGKKIEPGVVDRVSRARSSCEDVARIRDPLPERGSFPPIDGVRHGSEKFKFNDNDNHCEMGFYKRCHYKSNA